jgi:hypothetical protein
MPENCAKLPSGDSLCGLSYSWWCWGMGYFPLGACSGVLDRENHRSSHDGVVPKGDPHPSRMDFAPEKCAPHFTG